jgi:hypothetical protein
MRTRLAALSIAFTVALAGCGGKSASSTTNHHHHHGHPGEANY